MNKRKEYLADLEYTEEMYRPDDDYEILEKIAPEGDFSLDEAVNYLEVQVDTINSIIQERENWGKEVEEARKHMRPRQIFAEPGSMSFMEQLSIKQKMAEANINSLNVILWENFGLAVHEEDRVVRTYHADIIEPGADEL